MAIFTQDELKDIASRMPDLRLASVRIDDLVGVLRSGMVSGVELDPEHRKTINVW
jgi:hypothetical protein